MASWAELRDMVAAAGLGAINGPIDVGYYGSKAINYAGNKLGVIPDEFSQRWGSNLDKLRVNPTGNPEIDGYRRDMQEKHPNLFTAGEIAGPGGIAAWVAKAGKYSLAKEGAKRFMDANKKKIIAGAAATTLAAGGESVAEPLQDAFYRSEK